MLGNPTDVLLRCWGCTPQPLLHRVPTYACRKAPHPGKCVAYFHRERLGVQREKVTLGFWHVVAGKLAEFTFFFFFLSLEEKRGTQALKPAASRAGTRSYTVNSKCVIFS